MKKIIILSSILIGVILIILAALPFIIDINDIVASQVPTIEKKIHRKVTIGDVRLSLLKGLEARVNKFSITNRPEGGEENFVSVDALSIGIKLLPLLSGRIEVGSVSLIRPEILIERNARGQFNFEDMIPADKTPAAASEPAAKPVESQKKSLPANIEISRMTIKDGKLRFIDAAQELPSREIRVENLQASLKSLSLDTPIKMDIRADIPGEGDAGHVKLTGHIGPVGSELQIDKLDLDTELVLETFQLMPFTTYIPSVDIRSGVLSGRINIEGSMQNGIDIRKDLDWHNLDATFAAPEAEKTAPLNIKADGHWEVRSAVKGTWPALTIDGHINLDDSSLTAADFLSKERSVPFNLDIEAATQKNTYRFDRLNLNIADMHAEAAGSVTPDSKALGLNINLKTNTFSPAALLKLCPTAHKRFPAELTLPDAALLNLKIASVSPQTFTFSSALDLTKSSFKYAELFRKTGDIPLRVNASGKILENSAVIDDLTLTLNELKLAASATINDFKNPRIAASANIPSTNVSGLAPLLPLLIPFAPSGNLDMSAQCGGSIESLSRFKGIQGRLNLSDAEFRLPETGQNVDRFNTAVSVQNGNISVQKTNLTVGRSSLDIGALIKNIQKPQIDLTATSTFLDVDALMPSESGKSGKEKKRAGSAGPEESRTTEQAPGSVKEKPQKSMAPDLSVKGRIEVARGIYQKAEFKNLNLVFSYDNATALIQRLTADLFSGNISGNGKINLKNMAQPVWDMNLKSSNIQTGDILKSLFGIEDIITGRFNSELTLDGRGTEWKDIAESISGNGLADILDGELPRVNLENALRSGLSRSAQTQPLAQLIFPESDSSEKRTRFKDLSATFKIAGGRILTDNLRLKARDYALNASGSIGLDQSLDLKATADLSKSAAESVAEHKTLRYLIDENGHLKLPFVLKGSMMQPTVQIDNRILEDMIKDSGKKVLKEKMGTELEKVKEKLKIPLPDLFN